MKKADHVKALRAINFKCVAACEAAGSPDSVHAVASPEKLTIKEIVALTLDYENRIARYNSLENKVEVIAALWEAYEECRAACKGAGITAPVLTVMHVNTLSLSDIKALTAEYVEIKVEAQTKEVQQTTTQENNTMPEKTNKDICTPIIIDGFKQKLSKDAIISNCFDAGVRSIAELMKLYATITIEQNLVVDPKKATEMLNAEITQSDWSAVTSWSQIDAIIVEIQENVKGTEAVRIKTLITQHCNKNGIVLPPKENTGATGGLKSVGGVIMAAMVDAFLKNPKATKFDCLVAVGPKILPHVKDKEASAKAKVTKVYTALYAMANKVSLGDALVATCKQTFDAPVVVEAAPE